MTLRQDCTRKMRDLRKKYIKLVEDSEQGEG